MPNQNFIEILKRWRQHMVESETSETITVTVKQTDLHRLKALAKTFNKPLASITSELLHESINTLEASMPYVAGEKVIRVEEGQEIYEDIGPTPGYLAALNEVENS